MRSIRCLPYILKQIVRHRVRSVLTIAGVTIAMFLFASVQTMNRSVTLATSASAPDTTLVVYRKDRYGPATSQLPQDYQRRIEGIEGVISATPMMIVVSNCRTSMDVVTFRGVPKEEFLKNSKSIIDLVDGAYDDWPSRTDTALLGETLASRRGLRPGMRFDAAGITAYVVGIIRSDNPQDQNVAYTALEFVQLAGHDKQDWSQRFRPRAERSPSVSVRFEECALRQDRKRGGRRAIADRCVHQGHCRGEHPWFETECRHHLRLA